MQKTNTKHFEEKLRAELALVEKELNTVGQKNPANQSDWEPKADAMDTLAADPNEVADKLESFEDNRAVLNQLEVRYNELRAAMERVKSGAYGVCEVCKKPIENERLEANPAAATCIGHLK